MRRSWRSIDRELRAINPVPRPQERRVSRWLAGLLVLVAAGSGGVAFAQLGNNEEVGVEVDRQAAGEVPVSELPQLDPRRVALSEPEVIHRGRVSIGGSSHPYEFVRVEAEGGDCLAVAVEGAGHSSYGCTSGLDFQQILNAQGLQIGDERVVVITGVAPAETETVRGLLHRRRESEPFNPRLSKLDGTAYFVAFVTTRELSQFVTAQVRALDSNGDVLAEGGTGSRPGILLRRRGTVKIFANMINHDAPLKQVQNLLRAIEPYGGFDVTESPSIDPSISDFTARLESLRAACVAGSDTSCAEFNLLALTLLDDPPS